MQASLALLKPGLPALFSKSFKKQYKIRSKFKLQKTWILGSLMLYYDGGDVCVSVGLGLVMLEELGI